MAAAPLPLDESARLSALARYDVLDSPPEPAFDDLTALFDAANALPAADVGGCGGPPYTASCRNVFTTVTTGSLPAMVQFTDADAATLQPYLAPDLTDVADVTTLMGLILAGLAVGVLIYGVGVTNEVAAATEQLPRAYATLVEAWRHGTTFEQTIARGLPDFDTLMRGGASGGGLAMIGGTAVGLAGGLASWLVFRETPTHQMLVAAPALFLGIWLVSRRALPPQTNPAPS